jgi:hypothetical protein
MVMEFNATFNNISVIPWRSNLLVKETGTPEKKTPTCRKSLINFITLMSPVVYLYIMCS